MRVHPMRRTGRLRDSAAATPAASGVLRPAGRTLARSRRRAHQFLRWFVPVTHRGPRSSDRSSGFPAYARKRLADSGKLHETTEPKGTEPTYRWSRKFNQGRCIPLNSDRTRSFLDLWYVELVTSGYILSRNEELYKCKKKPAGIPSQETQSMTVRPLGFHQSIRMKSSPFEARRRRRQLQNHHLHSLSPGNIGGGPLS